MQRVLITVARESVDNAVRFSRSSVFTPYLDSAIPATSPAGPAPTISTSASSTPRSISNPPLRPDSAALPQPSFSSASPTILQVERRQRVVVYVERGRDLLVFEHRDHPEARTQVPAGGVYPDEELEAAAVREVAEETGVALIAKPKLIGAHDHQDGLGQPATSHFFRVDAPPGLPDEWEHVVTGRGNDTDLVFLCRFDPNPMLWRVQAVFRA